MGRIVITEFVSLDGVVGMTYVAGLAPDAGGVAPRRAVTERCAG